MGKELSSVQEYHIEGVTEDGVKFELILKIHRCKGGKLYDLAKKKRGGILTTKFNNLGCVILEELGV